MAQQMTLRERTGALIADIKSPGMTDSLRTMLGGDAAVQKFQQVVALTVQTNPDLVTKANKTSLLLACQQAAKANLLPDGKDGALVLYGDKVQWQVMIGGLRKTLARVGFDLRTEVVYENDTFDYELGDTPRITHKPALGKRGNMIRVYAIARGPDGRLYRRVMEKEEVDFIKSKAKTGNVWSTWYNAMAEKTVGRALVKQLPIYDADEGLRELIEADNANFDLGRPDSAPAPSEVAQKVQAAAREHANGRAQDRAEAVDAEFTEVAEPAAAPAAEPAAAETDPLAGPGDDTPF